MEEVRTQINPIAELSERAASLAVDRSGSIALEIGIFGGVDDEVFMEKMRRGEASRKEGGQKGVKAVEGGGVGGEVHHLTGVGK